MEGHHVGRTLSTESGDQGGRDSLRGHHRGQKLSNVLYFPVRELLSEEKGFTPEEGVECN